MELSFVTAISPLDGRYGKNVDTLRTIFSEFGFLKFRVQIEINWLKMLATDNAIKEIRPFNHLEEDYLNSIVMNFNIEDAERIKTIENITNHDIKAVEYFLKEKFANQPSLIPISEFIHFACTAEDINNLSYAMMLTNARSFVILTAWKELINAITVLAKRYRSTPMLSHTHGQPATPSTLGKEMANIAYRMRRQYQQLEQIEILGKINGAVGNYNAHIVAYPEIDWYRFSEKFVTGLGLSWNSHTTQIEPHDYIAEIFDCIMRFNTILIDFNRDIWGYLALNYLKQNTIAGEVGSSTMPHKVNPIDFEHAEGNLGFSNAIMNHFSKKLPISRWQRDLSDSTVMRNLGVGIGHSLIAYQSTLKGISQLDVNEAHLLAELEKNWQILAEPIQMVMRRYGIKNSYEKLKKLTRGKRINIQDIQVFIDNLQLPEQEKVRLKTLTPANYIGLATKIVDEL
ncbi:adenylosuccinate lyase [secondary endosymbiont of Heteropsylla cubana]|uniref:Adenylosuccinate lyase n=1 Tax=secondary endosymbiont of Heteropsylla cubana TaxID=134287 RepID=J3VUD3_9ENTR|nr:adenylosuccinate lyase [secondary endosymbiont of Heteropsylla cubana]AFP85746.1 adenylosuccinate lyase [secondary endosymbiont of Heteropsylla cubana]